MSHDPTILLSDYEDLSLSPESIALAARTLASLRASHRGGRPKVERRCPICLMWCEGAREAREHCRVTREKDNR